jgi:hypothetical protein
VRRARLRRYDRAVWALSEWAIYQGTKLIAGSADLERLAKWGGENWRAADPPSEMPLLKFLANWVRGRATVIKLEHARHWLGVSYRA